MHNISMGMVRCLALKRSPLPSERPIYAYEVTLKDNRIATGHASSQKLHPLVNSLGEDSITFQDPETAKDFEKSGTKITTLQPDESSSPETALTEIFLGIKAHKCSPSSSMDFTPTQELSVRQVMGKSDTQIKHDYCTDPSTGIGICVEIPGRFLSGTDTEEFEDFVPIDSAITQQLRSFELNKLFEIAKIFASEMQALELTDEQYPLTLPLSEAGYIDFMEREISKSGTSDCANAYRECAKERLITFLMHAGYGTGQYIQAYKRKLKARFEALLIKAVAPASTLKARQENSTEQPKPCSKKPIELECSYGFSNIAVNVKIPDRFIAATEAEPLKELVLIDTATIQQLHSFDVSTLIEVARMYASDICEPQVSDAHTLTLSEAGYITFTEQNISKLGTSYRAVEYNKNAKTRLVTLLINVKLQELFPEKPLETMQIHKVEDADNEAEGFEMI